MSDQTNCDDQVKAALKKEVSGWTDRMDGLYKLVKEYEPQENRPTHVTGQAHIHMLFEVNQGQAGARTELRTGTLKIETKGHGDVIDYIPFIAAKDALLNLGDHVTFDFAKVPVPGKSDGNPLRYTVIAVNLRPEKP